MDILNHTIPGMYGPTWVVKPQPTHSSSWSDFRTPGKPFPHAPHCGRVSYGP